MAKYAASVRWNDTVRITSTLVPDQEGTLLHEWFCDRKGDKPFHVALCSYAIRGEAAFGRATLPDAKEQRRIGALQREAASVFTAEPPPRTETFAVFPDMIGAGGVLGVPCIMDLFERQRTALIGGQEMLERLKRDEAISIVVYLIQRLELPSVNVQPRDEIDVSTASCRPPSPTFGPLARALSLSSCAQGFTVQGDGLFYCVKQSISHRATGSLCAGGFLKLAFVRDGGIVKAPAAVLSHLNSHVAP